MPGSEGLTTACCLRSSGGRNNGKEHGGVVNIGPVGFGENDGGFP